MQYMKTKTVCARMGFHALMTYALSSIPVLELAVRGLTIHTAVIVNVAIPENVYHHLMTIILARPGANRNRIVCLSKLLQVLCDPDE